MTLEEMVRASAKNDITVDEDALYVMQYGETVPEWTKQRKDRAKARVWKNGKRGHSIYVWSNEGVWKVDGGRSLFVPPINERITLIGEFHGRGHHDARKTCSALQCNFWWFGMGVHVAKYCKDCGICTMGSGKWAESLTLTHVPISKPWYRYIDLCTIPSD